MGRLIVIGIVVVLVVWLLRRAIAGPRPRGGAPNAGGDAQEPGAPQGDLVSCAHCGVNLPKAEARSAGGRYYCSEEHWRRGPPEG
jgi:uncharacterized protein